MERMKRRYPVGQMPVGDDSPIGRKLSALTLEIAKSIPDNEERDQGFAMLEIAMGSFAGAVMRAAPLAEVYQRGEALVPFRVERKRCRG